MAEVRLDPVKITIGDDEYAAFGEQHSWADIVRWIAKNRVDLEVVIYLAKEAWNNGDD
jgi:hypothetical protein